MAKITYADKTDRRLVQLPNENKVSASDLNEIKQSVNAIYDGNLDVIENNLSILPKYESEVDAIADGLMQGDSWFDKVNKTFKRIWNYIQSYTAGRSTIDFNNLGGDNWSVDFKIAVNDLPNGWAVNDYDYSVNFVQGGVLTLVESGTKTSDYTVTANLTGNGAGVYGFGAEYHMTNGSDSGLILTGGLVKVDASGNILGSIFNDGMKVNSVNGLQVNYTAYVTQVGVSELINVAAIEANTYALTQLSNNLNGTITLPLGSGGIAVYTDLDPIFWSDLGSLLSNPFALGNMYTLTIL